MLHVPVNEWSPPVSSIADGTRPAAAFGSAVTPTQNNIAGATYTQLVAGASVTEDVYEIAVCVNTAGIAAAARDTLVTIGVDLGAGYVDWISGLVCGPAGQYAASSGIGGPVWFCLPVRIPAGATIGAKASVNSATLTAINVCVELRGGPSRPELARAGGYVDSLGVVAASSRGTAVTPGAAAEGAWTLIGTLTRDCFFLAWGLGIDDSTMASNAIHLDLGIGDGTNNRVVVSNAYNMTTSIETLGHQAQGAWVNAAAGDGIYARLQSGPNAADNGIHSVAVYAVGG